MEEFDDDDFSDLYADVVVQASSAITAMHRLTEMRQVEEKFFDNATRREKEVRDGLRGGSHKIYGHVAECEDEEGEEEGGGGGCCLTNLPLKNGDVSGSESEDDLYSCSDDGYKQKFDEYYESDRYDDRSSDVEFGVINGNKRDGGPEFEEDEKRRGGIDEKEMSVNGGDHNSQSKSLKYNSLGSKKKGVDEMAGNVHKSCKKGNAEDNQTNIGRKYGGPSTASESCRPLDLDKCGSVQISDSVEDNHHEVSDYDSDGMTLETSDDTRRKTSSTSNKVSSAVEPESSESGWSQHGRGPSCSPSPSIALGDKYIGKSHKYSRHPSSSLARELHEEITHDYHPSKDSKSDANIRGTRDGGYCERQRGVTMKHSHQPRKSNDMPHLKTQWTNGDASYTIDVKRTYNGNVRHGKQRTRVSFKSNGNYMPYCSRPARFFTQSGGFLPDYSLGPAYMKNQYPDINPSCRYKEGWINYPNISERQIFLEKRFNKMDYEALGDDCHLNHWRHPIQDNIKGLRKFSPNYSSSAVNQRGCQFNYEVDDVHFRRRAKDDYVSLLYESDNKFLERKYRRIGPSGRNRDHLDNRCDRHIARQTSGRGKRRCDSRLDSSDNLWYTEMEVNDRRNIKHQSCTFYSSEEPWVPGRGQFPESSGPKSDVGRNTRCLWKEQHIENDRYGTNFATYDTRDSLRYHHSEDHLVKRRHYHQPLKNYIIKESIKDDEDSFFRRRHQRYSEVLHSREAVYKSLQQDDIMFNSEEPSYHFEKISRNNRSDDRHVFGHVEKNIDEREANRERTKMIRDQDSDNQFDGWHKSTPPRYQDSIGHFVVLGRKCTMQSSRRTSEAGEDKYSDRSDRIGWNDNQKSKNFKDSDDFHSENAVLTNEEKLDVSFGDKNQPTKFSENQHDEFLDIEEGQIITEEMQDPMKRGHPSENVSQINDKWQPETASDGNVVVQGLDDEKIREIVVKMERRKERFREPITMGRDSVKASYPFPELDAESEMAKLERPARKRRWSGT